ncbi:MAG: hypothetical protein KAT17_04390 [Candidatus Aminicenantes bacterium]|nr:hypothetical protein [Candidatus Aminicenantes bacterium]
MSERKDSSIILKVNDGEISLNPFVETVFINVIRGMIDSLDKIPQDKEKIDIQIRS